MIVANVDVIFVNVFQIILGEYPSILHAFEQVQDTFEPLHVFKKLFAICLEWHQDHGEDVLGKLGPLLELKSSQYVSVVLLRLLKLAHDLVAQGSKVSEVDFVPLVSICNFCVFELGDGI